ncbi:MAG TPA: hypothetical protein VH351_13375 [Bryobacteraceae bacterium]|jgi:hypothetical protein|nr:hypothetical protein [Bryobacteraceae bacterium]
MSEPVPPIYDSRLHAGSDFPVDFVRGQLPSVFTLIFKTVGNRDEAQELTQETFIKLFQRKGAATNLKRAVVALPAIASDAADQWLRRGGRAPMPRSVPSRDATIGDNSPDWARLEHEILGNIAVGLDAARCIEKIGAGRRFAGTSIALAAGASLLFVIGWVTHIPMAQTEHLLASIRKALTSSRTIQPYVRAETDAHGIAVNSPGGKLLLALPPSARVWASGKSEISAAFTDDQTSQVMTITVYGQDDPQ